ITIAVQELYTTAISCVKIYVLLMYDRIFGRMSQPFYVALWATGTFIVAYNFVQFLVILLQCRPVQAAWDPNISGAKCIKLMLELEITGGFNALTDIITVCLPMPLFWRAQMAPKKKYQVMVTFLVGGFVCVVSVWRIPMQAGISLVDASYTDVTACNWTFVEISVAIVCGCLPTLRPLLRWCVNGGKTESRTASGYKTSSSTSWLFGRSIWPRQASFNGSDIPRSTEKSVEPWRPDGSV
ncbi:MAG: hypothetical protein Q9181_005325, partial [Wetmoreana brouardii]